MQAEADTSAAVANRNAHSLAGMPAACMRRAAPALADDDGVALVDAEAGRDVRRDVAVALLVPAAEQQLLRDCLQERARWGAVRKQVARANAPRILLDVMRVVAPHDDGAVHLCRLCNPCTRTAHLSARTMKVCDRDRGFVAHASEQGRAGRPPDKMRPQIDTLPVKGHFLSM